MTHLDTLTSLEERYDGPIPPAMKAGDARAARMARVRVYSDLIRRNILSIRRVRSSPLMRCAKARRLNEIMSDMTWYREMRKVELRKLGELTG